mmetsp:Transcript_47806/g.95767  ORF Transcript_47806/g.95767 Transcript_47806/m.95767 type:complete len:224 (-) Transcript_47806:472-1143(-)
MCVEFTCTCRSDTSQTPFFAMSHILPAPLPVLSTTPPSACATRTHPSTVKRRCWLSERRSRKKQPPLTLLLPASSGVHEAALLQHVMASSVENWPSKGSSTLESILNPPAVPTVQGFSSSHSFTLLSQRSACGTAAAAGTRNDGPLRMTLEVNGSLNAVDGTEMCGRTPTLGDANAFCRSTSAVSTHGLSALFTSCPNRQQPVNLASQGLDEKPSRPSLFGVG